MGEVYLAEQERPLRRRVAVKVIKPGMDTRSVIGRFESERQALALMDHPNIARVFDAGSTSEGRPYFVMEWIQGIPITDFCDRGRLSTKERLRLFLQVCEGVQHAHRRGIIHRDLKPSNILVSLQDSGPVPKIIDFGVARAIAQPLSEHTVLTEVGQIIGTPEYMSPEQADFSSLDIDTRTDVYSLGVVLYQLLVGVLPFDFAQRRMEGLDAVRKTIREEEPARPSTRLVTMGRISTEAARNRKTDVRALVRDLKGDLDWICLKALEKDRSRRYDSPHELGEDIQRHLRNEAVLAGPPGVWYRIGKLVRRHRVAFTAAALVLMAILIGTGVSVWQAVRATRAETAALQEAETARQVEEFLIELFQSVDPGRTRGEEITAREVLDRGAERIDRELQDEPLIKARVQGAIGNVYLNLGLYERARPLLEESLEIQKQLLDENDPQLSDPLTDVANLEFFSGNYSMAEELHVESLRLLEAKPEGQDRRIGRTLRNLGQVRDQLGDFESARSLLERALEIGREIDGEESSEFAHNQTMLAAVLIEQGEYDHALELFESALETVRKVLGPDHYKAASILLDIGRVYDNQGESNLALDFYRQAKEALERSLGSDHTFVAAALNNIANVLRTDGRLEEAADAYQRALEINEKALGPDHPSVATVLNNLGIILEQNGRVEEARQALMRSLDIRRRILGGEHPDVGSTLNNLGMLHFNAGEYRQARTYYEKSLEITRNAYGEHHPEVAVLHHNLGELCLNTGELVEARTHYETALELWQASLPSNHPYIAFGCRGLASVLRQLGEENEARKLDERADQIENRSKGG